MKRKQTFRAWFSKVESRTKHKWKRWLDPKARDWEYWFNAGLTPDQASELDACHFLYEAIVHGLDNGPQSSAIPPLLLQQSRLDRRPME